MNVENDIEYLKNELRKKEELNNKLLLEIENLKSNNIDVEININQESLQEVSDDSILPLNLIQNKNDEKYKSIIQTLQEGIIIQDKNGNFIDANDHASLILGLSFEQLFGLTTFDPMWSTIKEDGSIFPPEEHPINLSLKDGIKHNNIIMGVSKPNNELTWISVNSSPIFDNTNKEIVGSLASFKDITFQKKNNDELNRNFKLLEATQLIGKLGGWELDLTTGNLFWTAETYRIHETNPEEFNPTVDAGVDYFLPESKEIIIKALELATTKGIGYDLYLETYTTKGNLIDVRTTCEVTMLNGKPIKLTGIFQDITDQKKIEREIKKVSERLLLATKAGEIGIWDWDIINNYMVWDEQMYKLYGIQENDYLSAYDAWINSLFFEDRRNAELDLEMSLKGEKDFSPIFRIKWKDDSVHYIKAMAEIFRDKDGNPIRMIGTNWDITEFINAQIKINETEAKFKTVFTNLQEGIAIHDENLVITDLNKSAEDILGLTLDQLQGRTSIDENWRTIHEDGSNYDGNTRPALKTLQTGKTLTNQIMGVYKPNGNLSWISINTVPLFNNDSDKPNGVLASFKDITLQKSLEFNIKEEKEKYKLLFENNPMPISVFDVETLQFLNVNEAFCDKYGYSHEEFLNMTILDIRPEEEFEEVIQSVNIKDLGVFYAGVYTHKKRNNELIKVEIIRHEINYEGKRAKLVMVIDVTEKLSLEKELILNKKVVESSMEGIIITDPNINDNPIIFCNQRFIEMIGYSKEEIIGKNCRFLQGPDTTKESIETLKQAIKNYEDYDGEILNYKKDGTPFWNNLRITHIKNQAGVVTHFVGIQNDITEKKTAEILLNERKRSLEDIFNFSPIPFVITKISNGEIIMVNNSLSKLLDEDANDIIGKFSHEYYSNKIDRNKILKQIEEKGELNNIDFILNTKSGIEIECLTSSKKIKLNNEYVNLISFLDIRKIKETETALIKAKNYAEEMSKLKSSFLANMSHELRTPMNGILGFSQFMNTLDDIDEAKEISELIYESSKRLMETLNLILDISTIESGVNEIEFENFDIIKIINDNITLFSKIAISKSLSLTLNTKFEKLIVNSNSKIIHSIISNLINNAIKFTNKGGIRVDLNIIPNKKHSTHKKWIKIKVIDTGIGIAKKHRRIIFDEFRQVSEGINRNFEGSGLGLTLTKKYVNLLGGEINVKSEVDKGSTFTFKIPI